VKGDAYTLPVLNEGNYFTETNGGGIALNSGDTITSSQIIYIYSETNTIPNCTNEVNYTVTINNTPTAFPANDISLCDNDLNGFEIFDLTSNENAVI